MSRTLGHADAAPAYNHLPGGRCLRAVRVFALCALSGASMPALAGQSPGNYEALSQALMNGKRVSVLLDLAQCTVADAAAPGPKVQGGMQISSFMIPNGKHIAFADVHATLDAGNQPVTEYIRYQVKPDNTAIVRTARLESNGNVKRQGEYQCRIDRGIRFLVPDTP